MTNQFSKIIKSYTKIIILALIPLLLSCDSSEPMFVGSKKSDKYHLPSCKWAKKIKPNHLIEFKTRSEAITSGYFPCKVCKP